MSKKLFEFLKSGFVFLDPRSDQLWMGWGDPDRFSLSSDQNSLLVKTPRIYAPDFFLKDSKPWWQFPECQTLTPQRLHDELHEELYEELCDDLQAESTKPIEAHWVTPQYEGFLKTVNEIQSLISGGTLMKAVPVIFQSTSWKLTPEERGHLLVCLLKNIFSWTSASKKKNPFHVYGMWTEDEGILGATPELLFDLGFSRQDAFSQVSEAKIQTMALAGTRKKIYQGHSLLEDPKERHEHRLVIDGIRKSYQDALGNWTDRGEIGFVQGETSELELPHLFHLHTPLSFSLSRLNSKTSDWSPCQWVENLSKAFHPTPALGAFPKENGRSWLEEQNAVTPRYRFGAPFAMVYEDSIKAVVSIRNIQWNREKILLGAGCGVVSQSQPDREWKELQAKADSVKMLFGI